MKSILITVLNRTAIVAILISVFSCQQQTPQAPSIDPGFTSYIAAFTSGYLSRQDRIRIRLVEAFPDQVDMSEPIREKLFEISPSVKGSAYWIDQQTIEFRPDEDMKSGTTYKVDFALEKIVDVPGNLKTFSFEFQTIVQNFDVILESQQTYEPGNLQWLQFAGTLKTADFLEETDLAELLTASQDGQSLSISWDPDPDGREHRFRIDSVQRKEKEGIVQIAWDGKSISVDSKDDMEIVIPALGEFTLMEVSVVQQPEQYILLRFSDPLQEKQYLNGLITLDNGTDLSFIVENNDIRAYPSVRQSGDLKVMVSSGIRNILGYKLSDGNNYQVSFDEVKPALRLLGKGVILPSSEGLILPFEAVNLKAIEVRIIRIYENNLSQFLQVNHLDGDYQLKRVGRLILRKTIQLNTGATVDFGKWNAFSLDLSSLIQAEPGAIYRIELGFKKHHSLYPCEDRSTEPSDLTELEDEYDDQMEQELSYWDTYEDYYYEGDYYYYDWEEREDPCSDSYYGKYRSVARNILASDLGIIAKAGTDHSLIVAVTDLVSTLPLSGVQVNILNFQQQVIGSTRTDVRGMASIPLENKPFLLIARQNEQRGYLRLDDGSSLSLSRFDVSGNIVQKGVKAFIYGERGVWRPGDTLFLNLMLEDRQHLLPESHPVTFELLNPHGQMVSRMIRSNGTHGFYSFITATLPDAPTGNWMARIRIGGLVFTKWLRIETVKPNRLKINLDFGKDYISVTDPEIRGTLGVTWLHGAVARNLKTHVSVVLTEMTTQFRRYRDFDFDDPVKSFNTEEQTLFDGRTDEDGKASFMTRLQTGNASPGMLRAGFITRVFEESGDFSIDRFSVPYSPYKSYVGIKTPPGDKARGMLLTDTSHTVNLVTLDPDGNPVSRRNLDVNIYKINWRWWWDAGDDNLASYIGNTEHQPIFNTRVDALNGEGNFQFRIDYPEWGRYLIRVIDPLSGHACGKIIYLDWPGWAGRGQREHPGGAAMLSFSADKTSYQVGEFASITFPSSGQGRALVSIENGSRVLDAYWLDVSEPETKFNFKVMPEMAPNIYVNLILLQPHAQTKNDLPIRLYGVIPILVEDPSTRLQPVIEMPDVLRPEEEISIQVSESNGIACSYTLAIVDEGLLDLTRFSTPQPWDHFYAREALGVRTWDIYNSVLGAYGGKIEQMFGIGGGFEEDAGQESQSRANRFKPMVKFIGPFSLKQGQKQSHVIGIPKYTGSVRTMVIAGNQFAYGAAEKTVPVKKPLMVLATLPRVLGPGEEVKLPVTVFAMEENINEVTVRLETNELFTLQGDHEQHLTFRQTGDQLCTFGLNVKDVLGIGKVQVIAKSDSETASYDIELEIRNPNPPITEFIDEVIEPGQTLSRDYVLPGMPGTNTATLEVSSIPPIDFGRRLKYLLAYPHGCIEQITSAAFPQLFLGDITELNKAVRTKTENNVKAAIKRIHAFMIPSGGFSYWPNSGESNPWATSYAGHFLLEAESKGYGLPVNFKKPWIKYQRKEARHWKMSGDKYRMDDLVQAYRLYTLALAGEPELGAMNRLREMETISIQARWRLAAAYALAGQAESANMLIAQGVPEIPAYSGFNHSYGSRERDWAMILETLTLLGKRSDGVFLARKISDELRSRLWMSTQTTAYCLLAMSKFAGSYASSRELNFSYQFDAGRKTNANTKLPVVQVGLDTETRSGGKITVDNKGEGVIFVRLIMEGIPKAGKETAARHNLNLSVIYTDMEGNSIDITRLSQGTDFLAHATITNPFGVHIYKDMALSQIFPSGWEIHNTRMDDFMSVHAADQPSYQDIRDDRVYTYFDIKRHGTNTYVIQLNAAYLGKYYLPAFYCEAMYDEGVNASTAGRWVNVIKGE
ncbi:MAG: hypothetical protein AMS26_00375 [Bacteroides sp. SM23_62]|nr:MAG: hypothetical protein AMS26_00375 [Bacteroides sp. SM23_62]